MPRVPVCLSACLCGLNPRTVPQLSLNKFSGLVLGLNVSISFVLCVLQMEHVQSRLDQTEVADIITSQKIAGSAGPTPVFVPACFYFLGIAVDALSIQWRRLHNTLSYCICCVKNGERKRIVGSHYRRS